MAFNPFNLFKGNPKVIELLSKPQTPLEQLLMEQAFISQFKKSDNKTLQDQYQPWIIHSMTYEKYEQMIKYITVIDPAHANEKNKQFKYPYVSAQILSISNEQTFKFLLNTNMMVQSSVYEEIEIEVNLHLFKKQIDSGSERSYTSVKSNADREDDDKENILLGRNEGRNENLSEDPYDATEDDFPAVKIVEKKREKVKQIVKKTIKKEKSPLVVLLLTYFQGEVTYILDGYICKVLENIINNKIDMFLQVVAMKSVESQNLVKNMLSHIQSHSVQELLISLASKLIELNKFSKEQIALIKGIQSACTQAIKTIESTIYIRNLYMLQFYHLFLSKFSAKLIQKVKVSQEGEPSKQKQKSLSILQQIRFIKVLFTRQHIQLLNDNIQKLYQNRYNDESQQIIHKIVKIQREFVQLYAYLKGLVGKDVNADGGIKEILIACEESFDKFILISLRFIIQDLSHQQKWTEEEMAQIKNVNKLSTKVQMIEVIHTLLKENVYFSRKSLIQNPNFYKLIYLYRQYPKSSVIHNSIFQIYALFTCQKQFQGLFLQKILDQGNLVQFLYECAKQDAQNRLFSQKVNERKCYIKHIIQICQRIEGIQEDYCEKIASIKQSLQWQYIHEELLEEDNHLQGKLIGGYQKMRQKKPIILFKREDIIKTFKNFLQGIKYTSFDEFANFQPQNSDSEQQSDKNANHIQVSQQSAFIMTDDNQKYFQQDEV